MPLLSDLLKRAERLMKGCLHAGLLWAAVRTLRPQRLLGRVVRVVAEELLRVRGGAEPRVVVWGGAEL